MTNLLQKKYTPEQAWQSNSFNRARKNFLSACEYNGIAVTSYPHPVKGAEGEELATDVALFGSTSAKHLLVLVSGVHGVESFSGSATQVGWINKKGYQSLSKDVAILMIHIINPWGASYLRRYNEDNIDLCRNFLDFSKPLPTNRNYEKIHQELVLDKKLGALGQDSLSYLNDIVTRRGLNHVISLFMAGQYQFPDGFVFGGSKPTWSNNTLHKILEKYRDQYQRIGVIEFHTGLGNYGKGEIVSMNTGEDLARVKRWYGPNITCPLENQKLDNVIAGVNGHSSEAYQKIFSGSEVTTATLEFGTYPAMESLALMLQEHVLYQSKHQTLNTALTETRLKILEHHHPEDWDWRCTFWETSLQMIEQAMMSLINNSVPSE
ncbi:MAG: DUF2817 domain-containing protein [Halieaceae bacterium]|nr:DUF2817 domain-containing protein [Halieaceae bacterium]